MAPTIHAAGMDYACAPLALRNRFTFSDTQKLDFSAALLDRGCAEVVILSTCNRSEVYWVSEAFSEEGMVEALTAFFGVPEGREAIYTHGGDAAALHLTRVSAGLESAVVGEDQILGQVRAAWEFAQAAGSAGKYLSKLFNTAITAAKRIKASTGMSEIPLSASYIGIKKLKGAMGTLAGKTFLIIGTGEMSMLAARYLSQDGPEKLYICSRSRGKALPLPEDVRYELVPFADRYRYAERSDGIVTATASPHTVLEGARMGPGKRPLFIVDMAVPPDVDQEMYGLPGVTVVNIDDLRTEADENLRRRQRLTQAAEEVISGTMEEWRAWTFRSRVDPALESLNRRCDEIAAETERFLDGKVDLSVRERKLIYKMLEASLKRLIREPVARLKALEDEGKQEEYIQVVRELFDL